MIKCKLCGVELKSLGFHIRIKHKITINEYKSMFPGSKIISDESYEKIKLNREKTMIKKYGVINPYQLESTKQKIKEKRNEEEIQKKKEETCLIKYGVKHTLQVKSIRDKIDKTNEEKYGNKNINSTKEIKDKIKETNIRKYGVEHSFQNKIVKDKIKETINKKYNADYPSQVKEIKDKIKETNIRKYGVENVGQSKEIQKKINITRKTNDFPKILKRCEDYNVYPHFNKEDYILKGQNSYYSVSCNKCGTKYETRFTEGKINTRCPKCFKNGKSFIEHEMELFFKSIYGDVILKNTRSIIAPKELDFYFEKIKLAIEYNSFYYHKEVKDYHLNKTISCEKEGIRLIHIFEDEWIHKKDIVKRRIKSIFGIADKIHARKCKIEEIDNKTKNEFLEKYHLQGKCKSSINIGLFYNNNLVAVMTFGKRKITRSKVQEIELLRFCSSFNIIGGASKLLKHYINAHKPKKIITYADRRWSNGNLYFKLGFKHIKNSIPNYWYIIGNNKYHRFNFRKDKLIKEGFDSNKTEFEIMEERGISKIYDCGNMVFEMDL